MPEKPKKIKSGHELKRAGEALAAALKNRGIGLVGLVEFVGFVGAI